MGLQYRKQANRRKQKKRDRENRVWLKASIHARIYEYYCTEAYIYTVLRSICLSSRFEPFTPQVKVSY